MAMHVVRKDLPKGTQPITQISALYGRWKNFAMTKATTLIGGLELSGVDPRTITAQQRGGYADLVRAAYQLTPSDAIITQYYMHFDNVKVHLKPRNHQRIDLITSRRQDFLNNERNLSGSRLFHLIDLPPSTDINKLASLEFAGHLGNSLLSKKSRDYVKTRLSTKNALFATHENLAEQVQKLETEIGQLRDRFGLVSADNHVLSTSDLWALMRVLYTLDPNYFDEALNEPVPTEHWDSMLPDGDIEHVTMNRVDFLKFNGVQTRYARLASIVGYGEDSVPQGFWINGPRAPVMLPGNYMLMSRWRPLSELQRAMMFFNRRTELDRSTVNIMDMVKGNDAKSALEEELTTSDTTKKAVKELEAAKALKDRFGMFCSQVLIFDSDPAALVKSCQTMNSAITQAGGQLVWENRGLAEAYESFLPGFSKSYRRDVVFTSSQFGAASHLYKSSEGVRRWGPDDKPEEAWYIFESEDGSPFYFTPYIGGRMVIIGVGPIRSGKTFTKNCIASHYQKFGGFFRAIDIDPGAEPIAEFFGEEDAGMFRLTTESSRGFNPFVSAQGRGDNSFKAHMLSQVLLMLKANDNPEMQQLQAYEQEEVDQAIDKTLRLPKAMQSLSSFYSHLGRSTQEKLRRWVGDGMYAHLFDAEVDAIGDFAKRIGTFNLSGVKDDPVALPLVMSEIFYRNTRLFENPEYRSIPKFLDCDEAHFLMGIRSARQKLITSIRTWGKWMGGVGLWTQSASEFEKIEDWPALRSAATTFFFMADPALDRDTYKRTFLLTDGELDAIANLIPKRQALIIQREVGISKVVNLLVEPEQYVINTSVAHEAETRRQMMREFGDPDLAIARTIDLLGLRKKKD